MSWLLFAMMLAVALKLCQAEVDAPCTSQDQCASDECCEIINMVIASKRRQLQPLNTEGTCQKYKTLNEACTSFEVINGFCGCAEGLSCQTVNTEIVPPPLRKRSPLRPGFESHCLPVL